MYSTMNPNNYSSIEIAVDSNSTNEGMISTQSTSGGAKKQFFLKKRTRGPRVPVAGLPR
jgi:hypothetical protein